MSYSTEVQADNFGMPGVFYVERAQFVVIHSSLLCEACLRTIVTSQILSHLKTKKEKIE
jgi:hypothetical protein